MSRQSPLHWKDNHSSHYEISIRNEYTRFACMFYLFTLFAFLSTMLLSIIANNSYYNESESIQRRFIPYCVLASISLALFLIFFIGSLVYTSKLIRKCRLKQPPIPLPRSIESSPPPTIKHETIQPFVLNTDESYYSSTKALAEHKPKTTTTSYQTDV
jgi:hypothetical protein